MLVSTKGRYALRIMLELGQQDPAQYIPLPLIARRQEISEKYLESIVSVLVKGGLVEGQRGKNGGYRLCRPLNGISVGELLRLTETSLAPVSCLEQGAQPCPRAGACPPQPMWERLDDMINRYLDSVTLADLLNPAADTPAH